ncbi:hypothetical protein A2Z53_03210 [Candidatus Giovannonibacteria bacterium RIFCSPHIGHO2_02_42_15]|uniref:Uncharacterized protein n=2 Tax=Candidatus Giovannoniibacteriota TaxID=1752738 RepID=A0A1F5VPK0_9BACT|nr:MAG: hypothetical protein UU07_C0036G0004 [Parcubacteria group bacterium GW2011_GWF1_40_5]KKS46265.1 MAG: hypothetical protein UV11_C0031G0015 [Candidatus Giovannonibacteria bacterium GW2011_GWF2_42_19]OGF65258.1 MAG: hypothetical protein A2Z53_03210 [Candidatus Giovannonibacteria bacterium RIFCSPHIGHO2_02_42_15]
MNRIILLAFFVLVFAGFASAGEMDNVASQVFYRIGPGDPVEQVYAICADLQARQELPQGRFVKEKRSCAVDILQRTSGYRGKDAVEWFRQNVGEGSRIAFPFIPVQEVRSRMNAVHQEQVAALESDLNAAKTDVEKNAIANRHLEAEVARQKAELAQARSQLVATQKNVQSLQATNEALRSDNESLRQEKSKVADDLARSNVINNEHRAQHIEFTRIILKLTDQLDESRDYAQNVFFYAAIAAGAIIGFVLFMQLRLARSLKIYAVKIRGPVWQGVVGAGARDEQLASMAIKIRDAEDRWRVVEAREAQLKARLSRGPRKGDKLEVAFGKANRIFTLDELGYTCECGAQGILPEKTHLHLREKCPLEAPQREASGGKVVSLWSQTGVT